MRLFDWLITGLMTMLVQFVSTLRSERGTASAYDTTLYTNHDVNGAPYDSRDRGGRVVPIYFEVTIDSTTNIGDTYNLFTLPKGWSVCGLQCTTNGLGASAGSGVTFQIGDDDTDRLMKATDFDAAEAQGSLAYAGVAYRPTADKVMLATIGTAAAVAGKIVKGHVLCVC